MGLVENLVGSIQKMGIIPKFMRFLPLISALCAIIGTLWLAVFPLEGQYRNTYVSENALLPHQASTHFRESEWEVTRAYLDIAEKLKWADEEDRNAELAQYFKDVGLKTATSTWTQQFPYGQMAYGDPSDSGETLYSVLHAPRGSSNEAIVVVAPWFVQDGSFNKGGVALLLNLARYFSRWSVWHKNLIFVIPSNTHVALRRWVEDYHTSLQHTAGSIEGVVVLDYSVEGEFFENIEIFFDGLNGQLPNLDLLNTVVSVADGEHLRSEILGMNMNYHLYKNRFKCLLRGIKQQFLSGFVIGHGSEMFSGWRIDAITIKAKGTQGPHDITTFGRVAESTVRSINNLLEHFHQSFFFYLLLGPKQFVSIGTYLPSAVLVANSYVLMAGYYFWTTKFSASDILPSIGLTALLWLLSSVVGFLAIKGAPSTFTLVFIYANVLFQLYFSRGSIATSGLFLQYAFSLTTFSLGLTILATLNYSASLILSLAALPLAWIEPRAGWTQRNIIFISITCPLFVYFVVTTYFGLPYNGILMALVGSHIEVGSWHWRLIHVLWLPMWLSAVVAVAPEPEIVNISREEYEKLAEEEIEGSIN